MLRIAELLPAGEIAKPTKSLAAEWYYMTYHKADRDKFVASAKKLANETIESLTEYFQALFAQKKSDGTLEKQEMDRLRNRVRKRVAEDLRHKIRASQSSRKPYAARCEEYRCRARDNRRSHYDRRNERDCTSRATSSRGHNDDGGRRGPSHARSRKPSGSSSKRDGGEPCSFHSPPGALPARHTWEQCSENPWNSKARAEPCDRERRRDTAYMNDPRYRSSDDERSTGNDGILCQVARATIPMERSMATTTIMPSTFLYPNSASCFGRKKFPANPKTTRSWPARTRILRTPSWPTMILWTWIQNDGPRQWVCACFQKRGKK